MWQWITADPLRTLVWGLIAINVGWALLCLASPRMWAFTKKWMKENGW